MTEVHRLEGYKLKVGDTAPSLRVQLLREDGKPKPLSSFTATITIKRSDADTPIVTDGSMQVENASNGIVSYDWSSSNTTNDGTYIAEVTIDDGTGTTMTFPNRGTFNIYIEGGLN